MKYPQIHKAKALDDTTLVIEFTNGELKKYDICHLLETPMFSGLRQPTFFRNFQVEPGGYAIVWNEEIYIKSFQ